MKANELRIGNYITDIWAHKNSYFKVRQIGEKHLWYGLNSSDSFKALNDNIRPIPITEDWLVKFGFKQDIDDYDFLTYPKGVNKYHDLLSIHKTKLEIYIGHDIDWTNEFNNIKYIHQLQNLYFALTGKELILKELNKNETFKNR